MRKAAMLACIALLGSHGTVASAHECPIKGEPVQWIADYCMFKESTDDLEAAMPCIETEQRLAFSDVCAQKMHFKKLLCVGYRLNGVTSQTVEQCIANPKFSGPVVENNCSGN